MTNLSDLRVACIAGDGVEEAEILEPVKALRNVGASVDIFSPKGGEVQSFNHFEKASKIKTQALKSARPDDYDALLLPGGALNADTLRAEPGVKKFVHSFDKEKKPIAFICHAPWILISAGVMKNRTVTGYHTIEDDVRNAGGHWVDHEVACDHNWVSSRQPGDLPVFNREMLNTFAEFSKKTQTA